MATKKSETAKPKATPKAKAAPKGANADNTLLLETTKGLVTIELLPDLAPKHVAQIKTLVRKGFYDGLSFHRVIEGFMAQGGCPDGTGMGGSSLPDIPAEFSKEPHIRGICSMARSRSPNSANSQFFICFDDATFLDEQYSVWGRVTAGMEAVDAFARGEPPRTPERINSAKIAADA